MFREFIGRFRLRECAAKTAAAYDHTGTQMKAYPAGRGNEAEDFGTYDGVSCDLYDLSFQPSWRLPGESAIKAPSVTEQTMEAPDRR